MRFVMLHKIFLHCKRSVTKVTTKAPHRIMNFLMPSHLTIRAKTLPTRFTHVTPWTRNFQMNRIHVFLQLPRTQERLVTLVAYKTSVLRMRDLVTVQTRRLRKARTALVTNIRLFTRVRAQVFGQVRRNCEAPPTKITIVTARPLVHRVDVNGQFVSRFERLAATITSVWGFITMRVKQMTCQRRKGVHYRRTLVASELGFAVHNDASRFFQRACVNEDGRFELDKHGVAA